MEKGSGSVSLGAKMRSVLIPNHKCGKGGKYLVIWQFLFCHWLLTDFMAFQHQQGLTLMIHYFEGQRISGKSVLKKQQPKLVCAD